MNYLPKWHRLKKALLASMAGVLMAALALVQPARAGEADKLDSSLKLMPADTAFYSTMLRNREQLDILLQSRAWAKFKAMPGVQMVWQMVQAQLKQPSDPKFAEFLKIYQQPENQQLMQLLGDMVSDEIYMYGGENVVGFLELLQQVSGSLRFGPVLMHLQGQNLGQGPKPLITTVLRTLSSNLKLIKFPDVVLGFKIRKHEPAEAQLKRLEDLLTGLTEQVPPLKGRLKRAKAAGGDFLTLSLDGSMVPWEMVSLKEYETKEGEFGDLDKKLRELKLTVGIGIRDNYLLIVFGESLDILKKLGTEQRLMDRPEFKPLSAHTDKRITSIGYVSQALMARLGTSKKDIDQMVETAGTAIGEAPITDEQRERIKKDLAKLAEEVKTWLPEPGAALSFSYLTKQGSESFSYNWGSSKGVDSSKPLTLLDHVGGSPILAVVGRSSFSTKNYGMMSKWMKVAYGYFEEIVVPKFGDQEKQMYEKVSGLFLPLLKRLDETTAKQFLPALADGQWAFVLDGKLESKQWHKVLPAMDKPTPLLEPALVVGVSDAGLLREAVTDYRSILNEMIAKVHELEPQIPDYQIPEPQSAKLKSGTSYFYGLPDVLGLDSQIQPNAGLSDTVGVLSLSQDHTERLLTTTPLKAESSLLADAKKPLAMAVYFDWAGMVNTLTPWLEFGVKTAITQATAEGGDEKSKLGGMSAEDILKQVHTVLDILKVFRSYTSITYLEDKALVTHSETIVKDLP